MTDIVDPDVLTAFVRREGERAVVISHVLYKRDIERSLRPDIAGRMLTILTIRDVDYQTAYREACWPMPAPATLYHSAPCAARASIREHGLRASDPSTSDNWPENEVDGQPVGVYLEPHADERGKWRDDLSWDVWTVNAAGLDVQPDMLNPGCYVVLHDIEPARLVDWFTWTSSTVDHALARAGE